MKEYQNLFDEDSAHEERKKIVEWLNNPQMNYEDISHKLEFYDEAVIFKMAKALNCDPVKAEVKFQEISMAIETLRELKDEFYEIMDV